MSLPVPLLAGAEVIVRFILDDLDLPLLSDSWPRPVTGYPISCAGTGWANVRANAESRLKSKYASWWTSPNTACAHALRYAWTDPIFLFETGEGPVSKFDACRRHSRYLPARRLRHVSTWCAILPCSVFS